MCISFSEYTAVCGPVVSGTHTTTWTVLQTLGRSYMNRNRLLYGLGLGVLAVCLVASVFKKRLKKKTWSRRLYRGGWAAAVLLILLSLTAGAGTGLGFGDGSGVGVGDGAGAGIGSETGVGDEGGEGTQEALAAAENEIVLRIHNREVTAGETVFSEAGQLEQMLSETYYDGMSVTVWDDYADNAAYLWVTETIKKLAIPYQVKRVEE